MISGICKKCNKHTLSISKNTRYKETEGWCRKCTRSLTNIRSDKKYKEERSLYKKDYYKNKIKTDINFKLSLNLRTRLKGALKSNYKSGLVIKDLGCSIEELKFYLESKFQPGMTWENYGFYGWHIDHIRPLASFDLTDRNDWIKACHYTNLQPLWAKDNCSKGKKYF